MLLLLAMQRSAGSAGPPDSFPFPPCQLLRGTAALMWQMNPPGKDSGLSSNVVKGLCCSEFLSPKFLN